MFTSQIIAQKINKIALPIKKHKLKFKNVYTYRIPYNLQNGNTLLGTCNIWTMGQTATPAAPTTGLTTKSNFATPKSMVLAACKTVATPTLIVSTCLVISKTGVSEKKNTLGKKLT